MSEAYNRDARVAEVAASHTMTELRQTMADMEANGSLRYKRGQSLHRLYADALALKERGETTGEAHYVESA